VGFGDTDFGENGVQTGFPADGNARMVTANPAVALRRIPHPFPFIDQPVVDPKAEPVAVSERHFAFRPLGKIKAALCPNGTALCRCEKAVEVERSVLLDKSPLPVVVSRGYIAARIRIRIVTFRNEPFRNDSVESCRYRSAADTAGTENPAFSRMVRLRM